jgi:hypothetical protein
VLHGCVGCFSFFGAYKVNVMLCRCVDYRESSAEDSNSFSLSSDYTMAIKELNDSISDIKCVVSEGKWYVGIL